MKGSENHMDKLNAIKEKAALYFNAAIKYLKIVLLFLKKNSKLVFAVVSLITVIFTSLYSGVIVAYSVEYNGKPIAIVKSKADYQEAMAIAQGLVKCDKIQDYAYSPDFSMTITLSKKISKKEDIAINILDGTESIDKGDALFVNGEYVACTSYENNLSEYVKNYLETFNNDFEEAESEFVEKVTVENGYYPCAKLVDISKFDEILSTLQVKTTVTLRKQTAIPFNSVTRKTDTRYVGDSVKAVTGQNGIEESLERIVYVNGEETERQVLESVVVKSPVDEVVVIGTKKKNVSSALTSSFKPIWPLKRVPEQVISSYWGDGRNHQALDIASPSGTPIYAAQSGTVITSTYISSYGNYIIIDHGNGYQTCYAHASKLYVSVGESVAQGQVIAAVGSTGNSTGNHLHFEIRRNGTKVDPALYLNVY